MFSLIAHMTSPSAISAVTVGNPSNPLAIAVLGGSGTVGNVTVGGAISGNAGASLSPHEGTASITAGITLSTGALTFTDSSTKLKLGI